MKRSIRLAIMATFVLVTNVASPLAGDDDRSIAERLRNDLPRDAADGVKLFAADCWAVATKPARLDGRAVWKLASVLVVGGYLYALDEDIDRALRQNSDNDALDAVVEVGDKLDNVALMGKTNRYYAAGIALGYVFGWEKLQRVSTDILFSHFIAGLVRNGGKIFVGRARPREGLGAYEFGGDGTSLPSGHASSIFQLATVLSKHVDYRPASVVFYALATTVAIERAQTREHWASDVWIGAWNGRAISQIIMKEHDEKRFLVVPSVVPETGAVGLLVELGF